MDTPRSLLVSPKSQVTCPVSPNQDLVRLTGPTRVPTPYRTTPPFNNFQTPPSPNHERPRFDPQRAKGPNISRDGRLLLYRPRHVAYSRTCGRSKAGVWIRERKREKLYRYLNTRSSWSLSTGVTGRAFYSCEDRVRTTYTWQLNTAWGNYNDNKCPPPPKP